MFISSNKDFSRKTVSKGGLNGDSGSEYGAIDKHLTQCICICNIMVWRYWKRPNA